MLGVVLVIFLQKVQKTSKTDPKWVQKSMPGSATWHCWTICNGDKEQWHKSAIDQSLGQHVHDGHHGQQIALGTLDTGHFVHSVNQLCTGYFVHSVQPTLGSGSNNCTGHFVHWVNQLWTFCALKHSAQPTLGSGSNNCAPTAGRATGSDLASDLRCPKTPTLNNVHAPSTRWSHFAV